MKKEELIATIKSQKRTLKAYAKELGITYAWLNKAINQLTSEGEISIKDDTANKILEPLGLEVATKTTRVIKKKGE